MFRSVRIQNFRQFKDLKLENLGRINLITGQNNTGKTSLLEALYLLLSPSSPSEVLTLAGLRGIDTVVTEGPDAWGWIFHDRVSTEVIEIAGVDDRQQRYTLLVKTARGLQLPIARGGNGGRQVGSLEPVLTTSGRPLPSLLYEYEDTWGQHGRSRIRLENGDPIVEQEAGEFQPQPHFFLANRPSRMLSDAQVYSRIVQAGRERDVIEALRMIDPRLERLQILDMGSGSRVYVDFGDSMLLPLNVTGQGFGRSLSLVSHIVGSANGIGLIDEIEDGLHYSVMADVWKAIIAAAHQHDVQLFVTTHSMEAIEAAVEGSEGYEGSLAFYRLERQKTGEIGVIAGEDRRLRSAVKVGAELR